MTPDPVNVYGQRTSDRAVARDVLEAPLDVPGEVLDFAAGHLETAAPSRAKPYTKRAKTRFGHQWEIRQAQGLRGVRRG